MRREWSVPTDKYGPRSKPAARMSRTGLGARLIMKGNPGSFLVDWIGPCVPFLSLSGGQDQASQDARQLGNFSNEGSSQTYATSGSLGADYSKPVVGKGTRTDLNGGKPFALWASRKTLPNVNRS